MYTLLHVVWRSVLQAMKAGQGLRVSLAKEHRQNLMQFSTALRNSSRMNRTKVQNPRRYGDAHSA